MGSRKKYVIVGVGSRAAFYYDAIAGKYSDRAELVSVCDVNQTRMNFVNRVLKEEYGAKPVSTYTSSQFDEMIAGEKPDTVIVTSIDRTHHSYIVRALEAGCDVITEKPMTTDAKKCQEIIDAVKRNGGVLKVTFNYRYAPHNSKIRELIREGTIGDVFSVHFEWLLDTRHGADYFRRWHRDKRNSGGLLVHKATHHFDLINFWLDIIPEVVFAFGDLKFYGRENAEKRGVDKFYSRAYGNLHARDDYFALHLDQNPLLKSLYLDAEKDDGYFRDQSVFGDGISIEDTMAVLVRYRSGVLMTYSLNAYMPWEGFRVVFNGSKGRIEADIIERGYTSASGKKSEEGSVKSRRISVFPMFGERYEVEMPRVEGGHGGGDPLLLEDLFGRTSDEQTNCAAFCLDGARSILTGIAANISMRTASPVRVSDLVRM